MDPHEGVDDQGRVRTGVSVDRVPTAFQSLLAAAVDIIAATEDSHSIHLYGSVATGRAVPGRSDLDLLVVTDAEDAAVTGTAELREQLGDLARAYPVARAVELSILRMADLLADTEEGRVERCFMTSYTVLVHGPDPLSARTPCQADLALARGFSASLLAQLDDVVDSRVPLLPDRQVLGRRLLMSAALLLSVRDSDWSTDRRHAVQLVLGLDPDAGAAAQTVFDHVDSRGDHFGGVGDLSPARPDPEDLRRLADWLRRQWNDTGHRPAGEPFI